MATSSNTYDANFKSFYFDSLVDDVTGSPTFGYGGTTPMIGTGKNNGDVVRFNNVIKIDGQFIDAVVTTKLTDVAALTEYDYNGQNGQPSNIKAYFQPNFTANKVDGNAAFTFDFYVAGTYTGAGTGTPVKLQHVAVNSYDIDSTDGTTLDRQYQEFKGFNSYEFSAATPAPLLVTTKSDGSVNFQATTAEDNLIITADGYRAKAYYNEMSSVTLKIGVREAAPADTYFSLDFGSGPAWTGKTNLVTPPSPALTYSPTTFVEAPANNGSIVTTSIITLSNDTFTGAIGSTLGVVSNVPTGLTAHLVKLTDTTAKLSFTGNATAHANINDTSLLNVTFGNSDFAGGSAAAVVNSTKTNLVIDFADPSAAYSKAPALVITADNGHLQVGESTKVSFTFNTDVGNSFDLSDIKLKNGTLAHLTKIQGDLYTADFTATKPSTNRVNDIVVSKHTYTNTTNDFNAAPSNLDLIIDKAVVSLPAGDLDCLPSWVLVLTGLSG